MKPGVKITVAFVLALLIIGGVGVRSYLVIQQLTESKDRVDHTHEVLENLEHVQSVVMEAETGARGFVLTGDEQFLAPYDSAIAEVQKDLASVKYLTRDNPDQQRDLEQLQKLCSEKLDVLKDFIQHRREGGLEAALPIIRSRNGARIMDEIRNLMAVMEQRENRLLDARSRDAGKVTRQSMLTLGLGMLLSLAILGVASVIVIRTMRLADQSMPLSAAGKNWRKTALRYAFALAIVALATWLKSWLDRNIGPMPIFVTFYPAVLLVATIAGGGPGIAATILSALAADYSFIAPTGSLAIGAPNDAVGVGIFAGTGIFLSILAERLRRAREAEAISVAQEKQIGQLKAAEEALREMNTTLEKRVVERTEELRATALYARSLLEASLDPLVTISPDGKVTDVNAATELVTGVPRAQLVGTNFSDYFTEPSKANASYQQVLRDGIVRDYPLTIRHASGRTTDVLYNATVYCNEAGEVQGVFAAARDVTERNKMEQELARYRLRLEELVKQRTSELEKTAAELARSNKDLEQFAYVASHDLQEPLRAVGGFVSLLKQHLKDKLDADGQKYIGHVVEGAERMQALINDLLTYSRVGSKGGARPPVSMKQALDDAVGNLSAAINENRAVIRSDPLPTVTADPSQMVQLLQNLVGNAIKFHGPRVPEIHIGARREKDAWVFSVRDNGIGIEPKYHDRIFLIFQRLHSRIEYPGTGIGLAVCKKIVERHFGRIWFESQPGEGTTFFFTISDKRSDE